MIPLLVKAINDFSADFVKTGRLFKSEQGQREHPQGLRAEQIKAMRPQDRRVTLRASLVPRIMDLLPALLPGVKADRHRPLAMEVAEWAVVDEELALVMYDSPGLLAALVPSVLYMKCYEQQVYNAVCTMCGWCIRLQNRCHFIARITH